MFSRCLSFMTNHGQTTPVNQSNQPNKRQMLVTAALPYANGPLHLGYMVEAIQSDIWVRFQRLRGHTCYFVCGDDAHGTPIMLKAEQLGISPETLIDQIWKEHHSVLKDFGIALDNFYTTHSEENKILSSELYNRLLKRGDITTRTIRQAYDPIKNMFLPDRYVKGECPKCHAKDQYGDNCEHCGATYSPADLINPLSVLSGVAPIEKDSEHYFFHLEKYEDFLKTWTAHSGHVQSEVSKKLREWFETGLQSWDISRDAPYFGFEIPNTQAKYFYVWMDAPIGYMASFKNFCDLKAKHIHFDDFWVAENANKTNTELYHFIGKDIIYFHALFWPAMLHGAGFRTPNGVFVHGFLTVDGQKMSKSRGTFITARTYLNHLDPDYLRYYFATKLGASSEDLDLGIDDFVQRVNSDLVGKLVNIASRSARFISEYFNGKLASKLENKELHKSFSMAKERIVEYFENREFNKAIRDIMALADEANRYIDDKKPWVLVKNQETLSEAHGVCTDAIELFRILMVYLKPVVPQLAHRVETFLHCELTWNSLEHPLLNHPIQPFQSLLTRIDPLKVKAMFEVEKSVEKPANGTPSETTAAKSREMSTEVLGSLISIDDFAKVDLRIAHIVNAEEVPEAQKLLKLTVDLGEEKTRQIFAGIKESYKPEDLIGKFTLVVANLEPRKMRFGISEGMLIVAVSSEEGGKRVWLLEPQAGVKAGMRVK